MALYSKLDVVNRGLSLLGQLPVNDLQTPHPAVPSILNHLTMANKQVQADKLWFNYERTTLIPQPDGTIVVPSDIASIDAVDTRNDISQRGRYLYNHATGTRTFDGPIEVFLHRVVPFEELPPTAAVYVMTQALLRLQAGLDGDGPRYSDLQSEDVQALRRMTAENTRNVRANLLHRRGVRRALHRINQYSPFQYRR